MHESEPSTQVQDHEDMQTDVGSHGKALHHTLLVCKCTIVYLICSTICSLEIIIIM